MRLIDVDAENSKLLDFIAEHDSSIQYAIQLKDMTMLEDIFFEYFESQSTAYDVDRVMGQLEEKALEHAINGQQFGEDGLYLEEEEEQKIKEIIEECIEVVKAGGVNE